MKITRFATVAGLILTLAGPVLAQPTQADVGSFLRSPDGEVIGSLHAINGNQAVVWYGFVNTPGNHLASVPLSSISTQGQRLVLNDTGMALAAK